MEDRLKGLIEANSEANRTKWAMEWKRQGGKVIGVMSSYVPEEVISSAGMLPWRITGTWDENISHALVYRPESISGYYNHALESLLVGELDFLDGIIATDIDMDLARLYDVIEYINKLPYCYITHTPFYDSELSQQFVANEIRKLITSLEDYGKIKISEDSLNSSIETYNKMRNLLGRIYELRKKEIPPLSGAEVLGITTGAAVMPKEEFNQELEALLPYLEKREANLKQVHPRLLVSTDMLDNPEYLDLAEEGCLVAMDDLDTGSRYFIQDVETTLDDPVYALVKRYQGRHSGPNMLHWDRQVEQMIKWVKEYKIDGILNLPLLWDYSQMYRMPWLREKLEEANIPNIYIEREYHLANVGQLRTRIGAFLEMLA
ncbi:2-hydroxyacyl-CoA dehydratase subunit D [Thermodesulfobacteriota bacterium]